MFSELPTEEEKSADNSPQKTGKPLNTALHHICSVVPPSPTEEFSVYCQSHLYA